MKSSKKKALVATLIVAALIVVVAVSRMRGDSSKEVEVAVVAEQDVRPTILASGVLAYLQEVKLTSEVIAKVATIHVAEGDHVQAGDLLLTLDQETYRNAITREEASRRQAAISIERQRLALGLATTRLERGATLLERRMIGQSDFDDLRNARDLARVELQGSEEALRRADAILGEARDLLGKTDIRAPITGTIVDLPIKVGETAIASTNAFAGASLMTIADTSAIQAELKVDEADIARIAVGQAVDVYATAFPDTALKGEVERIALAPTLENQARTYEVVALLDVPDGVALRSGMSARADIFLGAGGRVLAVPVEAVGSEEVDEKKIERYVWVERNGRANRVVVEVGQSDDRWEEIVSGLQAGDRVITGPARVLRTLAEGESVSIKERDPAAEGADGGSAAGDGDDGAGDDAAADDGNADG